MLIGGPERCMEGNYVSCEACCAAAAGPGWRQGCWEVAHGGAHAVGCMPLAMMCSGCCGNCAMSTAARGAPADQAGELARCPGLLGMRGHRHQVLQHAWLLPPRPGKAIQRLRPIWYTEKRCRGTSFFEQMSHLQSSLAKMWEWLAYCHVPTWTRRTMPHHITVYLLYRWIATSSRPRSLMECNED